MQDIDLRIYKPVHHDAPLDPKRCEASVADRTLRFARFFQCQRRWMVQEEGHHWCKQHAPSAVKERNEAARQRYEEQRYNDPVMRSIRRVKHLQEAIDSFLAGDLSKDGLREAREANDS